MSSTGNKSHASEARSSAAHGAGDRTAHELANLLDASLRNVGLVLSQLRQPADPATDDLQDGAIVDRLESINDAMQHMAVLVRQWLGRADGGGGPVRTSQRPLHETVDHAVRLLGPAASSRRIQVDVDLSPEAAGLPAGPVYPVVANALRNSIEAIEASRGADGHVQIAARLDGDSIVLTVTDDGPGLHDSTTDDQGRFRFGVTTKPQGHGLGLSLSKEIAASLGGGIDLHNRTDGERGAVLTFRYPRASVLDPAG